MEFKEFWKNLVKFWRKEEGAIERIIEYEETFLSKWGYWFLTKIFGPVVRWIWIKEVEGLENIPKEAILRTEKLDKEYHLLESK